MKCKALFLTKPSVWERGVLHAAEPYGDAAPVGRRASAVECVGAAHIGDGSRVSASQCLDGRPLAAASPCEGREPGEHGRLRSHGGEAAAAKREAGWRRSGARGVEK